jgi:transposase
MGSPHLTPAIWERICELHSVDQWGYKGIHQRYPWISLSTIRYAIKKEHERRADVSKPRSGRPKKLNTTDKVRLLAAISKNPRITFEDLIAEVAYKVEIDSIRPLLNAETLRKWRCSWRPYLTEENALERLRSSNCYHHFTPENWAHVFFSLTSVLSNEGLVFAENGPLYVRETSRKRGNAKNYHSEGGKLSICFRLLSRVLHVELV